MTGVLASFRSRRSRLLRFAAIFVLMAEAVGVALAPTAEAFASRSAPAHVEEGGTHLHHSHIPETCPACIALQLIGVPSHRTDPTPLRVSRYAPPPLLIPRTIHGDRVDPKAPRAPPFLALAAR